jgi:hypothetical protein
MMMQNSKVPILLPKIPMRTRKHVSENYRQFGHAQGRADVSEMRTTSFIRPMLQAMIKALHTSETSVYSNEATWHYIPEGYNLHNHRRENLKTHCMSSYS